MEEIWKEVVDPAVREGIYEVSDKGNVRYKSTGRVLNKNDNGFGYKTCPLKAVDKPHVVRYIHRLVAKAFLPNPDNFPQVGHKDHTRENNAVENLCWTTQSQNTRDGVKAGRINAKKRGKTNQFSPQDIELIAVKYVEGLGVAEIARLLGVPRTSVSSVINGRSNWSLFCAAKKQAEESTEERKTV